MNMVLTIARVLAISLAGTLLLSSCTYDQPIVHAEASLQWTSPESVDLSLMAASCGSPGWCLASDLQGRYVIYQRSRWSSPRAMPMGWDPDVISCAPGKFCIAAEDGRPAQAFVYSGAGWKSRALLPGLDGVVEVSCTSATYCMALDSAGDIAVFDGTAWSSSKPVRRLSGRVSLSCARPSFCAVVNADGIAWTYDRGQWAHPVRLGFRHVLLTCASEQFCMAEDSYQGTYAIYNGSQWFTSDQKIRSDDGRVTALACPGNRECVALTTTHHVLSYGGTGWLDTHIVRRGYYHFLMCPSPSFCLATGFPYSPNPFIVGR